MKNRVLRAVLLGAALGGLVLGASPAQAATLSWEDPAGDAKDQASLHNAAFDITSVKIGNDGGVVNVEIAVPGLVAGRPTGATGYTFRLEFLYGEGEFRLQVNENVLGTTSANLGMYGTTTTILPCEKCEGKIDRDAKKVFFSAPVADLDKGFQSAEAPPLAGQEWTALNAIALRPLTLPVSGTPSDGVRWVVDEAPAPEDTTLAF